jgi:hypothetical protein
VSPDPASLGRQLARRYLEAGARPKPSELAARLGIEVVTQPAPPPAQPGLRAEYQARPPRITLYLSTLAGLRAPEHHDLEELHIAHELLHHLEATGAAPRLSRADSEEAAHAFARELCGLSFDPAALG